MTALHLGIDAIGLSAPGLLGWKDLRRFFQGQSNLSPEPFEFAPADRLPRNEKRRASRVTRLAFAACEDALRGLSVDPRLLLSVFASSSGDMDIVDSVCRALCTEPVSISPMQFHNSVHNATAGYWSIATGATGFSTSLSAFDFSVGAGLIETALLLVEHPETMALLVCYDIDTQAPLASSRPVNQPFASALLCHSGKGKLASLDMRLTSSRPTTRCNDPILETLRTSNPAARILPLLEAIAHPHGNSELALEASSSEQLIIDCHGRN